MTFEFAGRDLADALTSAFADVRSKRVAAGTDLTVRCWDTETSGVEPPPPPTEELLTRGFCALGADLVRATFSAVSGVLQAYLPSEQRGYTWVRKASAVPGWEAAAPLRSLVSWATESWGAVVAHAAVIGRPDGGVLLAGPSGVGKSTTALAGLAAGAGFLADDCALIDLEHGPVAHAVYRTAKLDGATVAAQLPGLLPYVTDLKHDRGKAILAFPRKPPMALDRCPLIAVIVQGTTGSNQSRIVGVSRARALAALAPSTLLQSPGTGQRSLDLLADLVGSVPCYELQAGTDLLEVARTVLAVLE